MRAYIRTINYTVHKMAKSFNCAILVMQKVRGQCEQTLSPTKFFERQWLLELEVRPNTNHRSAKISLLEENDIEFSF